ncbi:transmembrane signal receptor [Lithospermum erythrorhizon]|uniref:Glutamate receptor n=1 Tax=Lithospermum erythrorhizon TaxID=34254 RepID=A0AAV3QWC8_LITER
MRLKIQNSILFLVFSGLSVSLWGDPNNPVDIGLIIDIGSPVGRTVLSCINMAISDIHSANGTRIELHIKDSKGDSLSAITSGVDLLNNGRVQAIIVPEMTIEASMLASLGENAEVPIFSFASIPSSPDHSYFLRIKEDEAAQFGPVIALLEEFNWKNIVLVYEETSDGRNHLQHIVDMFQEKSISVFYKSFDPLVNDSEMIDELLILKAMQTSVFVMHGLPSLTSKVLINSKRLSMMSTGYAWIVTSNTMDFEDSLHPSVIDAMRGALGLKSYIPSSEKLQNVSKRWKREIQYAEQDLDLTDFYVFGVRAYDTIWAVANVTRNMITKRIGTYNKSHDKYNMTGSANSRISSYNSEILSQLLSSRFRGLSGDYQFQNGKLVMEGYEVVNVVGKGGGTVGYWTLTDGLTQEKSVSADGRVHSLPYGVKTVIWPGPSLSTPKDRLFNSSGRRLQIACPVKIGFTELLRVQEDTQNTVTTVTGFVKEVFEAAIDDLSFNVQYDLVPYKDANGETYKSYDQIVESVYLKHFDAAIGDFTITSNRSLYVDFTMPFTELGLGTLVKLDKENRWFFFKPFDSDLWTMGACFFVGLGVVVWIIEHPINEEFQGSVVKQIGTILWFSVSTLVYAHRERLRSNLSKFVVGIWLFVVFILTASYTAILSSILTVQQIQLTKGENIGYQYGSLITRYAADSFNFSATDGTWNRYLTAGQYAQALSKGNKNGGVGAIIDEIPYIKIFLANYPSGYALLETSLTNNGFGFVFQKGSALVPELSRAIVKLRESGKLLELEQKWYYGGNQKSRLLPSDNAQREPKTLNLDNFIYLFFISGISKVIALFVIMLLFLRKRKTLDHLYKVFTKARMEVSRKCFSSRVANASQMASPPRVDANEQAIAIG